MWISYTICIWTSSEKMRTDAVVINSHALSRQSLPLKLPACRSMWHMYWQWRPWTSGSGGAFGVNWASHLVPWWKTTIHHLSALTACFSPGIIQACCRTSSDSQPPTMNQDESVIHRYLFHAGPSPMAQFQRKDVEGLDSRSWIQAGSCRFIVSIGHSNGTCVRYP